MTLDPAIFAFAASRLTQGGWTWSEDHRRLAEAIQSCVEEFEADLMEDDEEAQHGNQRHES